MLCRIVAGISHTVQCFFGWPRKLAIYPAGKRNDRVQNDPVYPALSFSLSIHREDANKRADVALEAEEMRVEAGTWYREMEGVRAMQKTAERQS